MENLDSGNILSLQKSGEHDMPTIGRDLASTQQRTCGSVNHNVSEMLLLPRSRRFEGKNLNYLISIILITMGENPVRHYINIESPTDTYTLC